MKDDPTQLERPPSTAAVPAEEERTTSGSAAQSLDAVAQAPTQLGSASSAPAPDITEVPHPGPSDPLSAIFRFHGQIRAALFELDSLALIDTPHTEHRRRARELIEFFTGPLVWHDVDEETSLLPRLRRRVKAEELEQVLERISHQHEEMESAIEKLLPPLSEYAHGHVKGDALSPLATNLHEVLEPHLALEERDLLPFARLVLTEEDLSEIKTEIESRWRSRIDGTPRAVPLS